MYAQVRDDPLSIESGLAELQCHHSKESYYAIRASAPSDPMERALRTLYLNRTCWNGLYRLNRRGDFNVPIGTKSKIILKDDNFPEASRRLQKAKLLTSDFAVVLGDAGPGDLVFVDPPYTVKHNMNGFVKYNESIFTWADQIRLRDVCIGAAGRGAKVIITNADHESIHDLYKNAKELNVAPRASVIAASSTYRSQTSELVIML